MPRQHSRELTEREPGGLGGKKIKSSKVSDAYVTNAGTPPGLECYPEAPVRAAFSAMHTHRYSARNASGGMFHAVKAR